MRWRSVVPVWVRKLAMRSGAEERMDEEMRFHLEMEVEKNLAAGLSPAEARRRAMAVFGGLESHKEQMRSDRRFGFVEDGVRDVQYAWRALVRAPGFALAAVLTIGLGIGANTAIFGVVDAMFLRAPAGVRDAGEVVRLYFARDEGMIQNPQGGAGSFVDYVTVRDEAHGFSETAAFLSAREIDLDRGAEARRVRGGIVSQNFFRLLGVEAAMGRLFLPEEDSVIGSHPVAVVSHDFWRAHYGSAPDAVGRTILLNSQLLTVVGVMQEGFTGIEPDPVDVWIPMAMGAPLGVVGGNEEWRTQPGMIMVNTIGRLAPGAEVDLVVASATSALTHAAEAVPELDPTPQVFAGTLVPAGGPTRSQAADLAIWLMAVVGIVLVIACANVANLLLSRAATRRRETAIRISVGASKWRVVRQRLTESLVISFLGAVVGLGIALLSGELIRQFPLPPSATEPSFRPLVFALALVVATALVVGIIPALQAGRSDPVAGLKDGRSGAGPGGMRVRRALIGVQVALSVVLLVGAVLFLRSLREVYAVHPGVDVDRLLVVAVDLRKAGYEAPDREAFYSAARERALRVPQVEAASVAHFAPLARMAYGGPFEVRDHPELEVPTNMNWVGPGYFSVAGTRLVRGQEFGGGESSGEPRAVVNESLAALLPGDDPIGMCVSVGNQVQTGECTRIVGVAENQRSRLLADEVDPMIFLEQARNPNAISWGGPNLVVRTSGDAAGVASEVRSALQSLDPRLPFVSVEPLAEAVRPELLPYRLGAILFTLFGVLALALAAVGLHGVLGYFIAERRPEIGIRRSLGAGDGQVVRLVVREGMFPVVLGLLSGIAAAYAGAKLLESQLFGIEARDPFSFAAAILFLFVVSLLASYLPARRAALVDPMVALRAE